LHIPRPYGSPSGEFDLTDSILFLQTLDIPLIKIPATELVAGVSGESEERIREVFEQAAALAPCVLFIDEIDVISSNRQNASKDMERRIVSQLIGSMDALGEQRGTGSVIVVGATSRPDALDPALRRVGRFDHEICLGIPDRKARYQILHMICYDLKLKQPFDYDKLALLTPGYVGADLLALAQRAAAAAIKRVLWLKQEQQAEQTYLRSQSLSKSAVNRLAAAIGTGEVVNLTDDTLIMDVDDVEVTSTKEAEAVIPVQNGEPADEASAMAAEETTPAVDELPKEPESTDEQIITTTTEAEVNGGGGDNNEPKLPEEVTATIPTDETMDTSENGEVKVVDEGPATVEKPADEVNTAPEEPQIPEAEASPEQTPVLPTEETAPLAEPEHDSSMVVEEPKIEEPNIEEPKAAEPKAEEPKIEEPTSVATVPEKKVKLTLTLESMMQWLTNDVAVLTEDELKTLYITMDDFVEALKHVQPSAKREGFITIPDVTWKDIGSLQEIRDELKLAVLAPVRFPDKMERLGLTSASGVLLCGPPGCGKTLLAKAVANEAGINFISVKGPELLNMVSVFFSSGPLA
jgi:SpoVK/Ycf46/Vps4 family AAA+-type ATPase